MKPLGQPQLRKNYFNLVKPFVATMISKSKFYLYYFSEKYYIQGPQKYFNILKLFI